VTAAVTAVVVSWNTREHLVRCLDALEAAGTGVAIETIVVDNGSTDGSQAMVAAKFPRVRIIQSPDNVGFGRAVNAGAAAGSGRAIVIANSDCEPAPGLIATLLAALDAEPRRFGVEFFQRERERRRRERAPDRCRHPRLALRVVVLRWTP
jgi:hypothetical protein